MSNRSENLFREDAKKYAEEITDELDKTSEFCDGVEEGYIQAATIFQRKYDKEKATNFKIAIENLGLRKQRAKAIECARSGFVNVEAVLAEICNCNKNTPVCEEYELGAITGYCGNTRCLHHRTCHYQIEEAIMDIPYCSDCSNELTIVRPGKWQCDYCDEKHYEKPTVEMNEIGFHIECGHYVPNLDCEHCNERKEAQLKYDRKFHEEK